MEVIVQDKKYGTIDINKILPNSCLRGSTNSYFSNARSIEEANAYSLVWIKSGHKKAVELVENTEAKFIICGRDVVIPENILKSKCFIIVENPRLSFAKILAELFVDEIKYGIDKTAIIHPNAKISKNVFIGANTYIGDIEIGEGTIIYGNSYIYDRTRIGKNCIIHAGVVIGSDGFGFEKNRNGEWLKFPQIGGVIICDDVEIGANSTIDKGALNSTFISQGVKIDNFCHIAHNVTIGENSIITSSVVVGGSSIIGKNCWIAPNVSIINGITINDNVFVGIGSVVIRSVQENSRIFGNPALRIGQ